jgi:hypothetical protein
MSSLYSTWCLIRVQRSLETLVSWQPMTSSLCRWCLFEAAIISLLTILAANNTLITSAALLLNSPSTWSSALSSCEALSETLWPPRLQDVTAGLNNSLAYEVFSGRISSNQLLWVGNQGGTPSRRAQLCQAFDINAKVHQVGCTEKLPAVTV